MTRSFALWLLAQSVVFGQQPQFDLLIQGGRVIDGTGSPWYVADVGIRGDAIVAIGTLDPAAARQRINARGLIVSPGFIDIHSHAARWIDENPSMEGHIRQGITSVLDGNDGGGPLPLAPALDRIGPAKVSINFGYFTGHNAIRTKVMGTVNRKATPDEIERMKALAQQAMLDGAWIVHGTVLCTWQLRPDGRGHRDREGSGAAGRNAHFPHAR